MTIIEPTLATASNHSRGENNLNLIRLLAALSVIYGHSYFITKTPGSDLLLATVGQRFIGGVAVDVFFVISGFLVTASALNRKNVFSFLLARGLRIYPALIVCVCLTVFVLGPIISTSPVYWSQETLNYLLYNCSLVINYTLYLPGVFENLPDKSINGPIWSILIELRLYVATAFLYMVGVLSRRRLFNFLYFFLVAVFYLRPDIKIPFLVPWDSDFHRGLVMLYFTGAFYYLNAKYIPLNPWILLVLFFILAFGHGTPKYFVGYYLFLPYFVMMAAFMPGLEWYNRVGDYSYGVYLYGWPVAQMLLWFKPSMGAIENSIFACEFSLVLAILSWHLVEKRMLSLKKWPGLASAAAVRAVPIPHRSDQIS
jgi:peptidoglycan/LPS O-acetylase OafA/YrhL